MRHILTSSYDDVKFPLLCKCPNRYGMAYRQPWGSGMVSACSMCPGWLCPARSYAVAVPRAAQACPSLLWRNIPAPVGVLWVLTALLPGLLSDCTSFPTQWEKGIGSSCHECPLSTWGTVKWMVKPLGRVRASVTPTVRQRPSRIPSWVGVICASELN